jgi:hypothetical protein
MHGTCKGLCGHCHMPYWQCILAHCLAGEGRLCFRALGEQQAMVLCHTFKGFSVNRHLSLPVECYVKLAIS